MKTKFFTLFTLFLFCKIFGFTQTSGLLQESFEGPIFPPNGWKQYNVAGHYGWKPSNTFAQHGSNSAYITYDAIGGEDWLVTPQFKIAKGDSLIFFMKLEYQGFAPDSLSIKVSTTTNETGSFTKTLLKLEEGVNYDPTSRWNRYAIDLSEYEGKNVFIGFKHFNRDGDGLFIDNVSLGSLPSNNVQAVSLDVNTILITGKTVKPKAEFRNAGLTDQTFNVTLKTVGYTSTKTISTLAANTNKIVEFDAITPTVAGTYNFTLYSSLPDDAIPDDDTLKKSIQVLDEVRNDGWILGTSLPAPRYGMASTSYRSGPTGNDTAYLVIIGGDTTQNGLASVIRLNTVDGSSIELASLPEARSQAQAFYVNGKIYYIGGYTSGFNPSNKVFVYDIQTNSWSRGADMNTAVGDYAGSQYNDTLIYIIAGLNGTQDVRTVQIYNTNTNTWSAGSLFEGTAVAGARAGISMNKILVTGGFSQASSAAVNQAWLGTINPEDYTKINWTRITDYPGGPTTRHAATGIPGSEFVYFTGGDPTGTGIASKTDAWAFDVITNSWLGLPNKNIAASNLQNLVPFKRNDSLYLAVVGGFDGAAIQNKIEFLGLGKTASTLPIELIEFTAHLKDGKVVLDWKASEDGLGGHYLVQGSNNVIEFSNLAKVAAGKNSKIQAYTTYDAAPQKGYNYYRLVTVRADGSMKYSAVRSILIEKEKTAGVAVSMYPNPTKGNVKVELKNNAAASQTVNVRIVDVAGKTIVSQQVKLTTDLQLQYILRKGSYFVQVVSGNNEINYTNKLIVQ